MKHYKAASQFIMLNENTRFNFVKGKKTDAEVCSRMIKVLWCVCVDTIKSILRASINF